VDKKAPAADGLVIDIDGASAAGPHTDAFAA